MPFGTRVNQVEQTTWGLRAIHTTPFPQAWQNLFFVIHTRVNELNFEKVDSARLKADTPDNLRFFATPCRDFKWRVSS